MPGAYTESTYENSIVQLFQNMGYRHVYGPDVDTRDYTSPLYEDELQKALRRINPTLAPAALHEALLKLKNFENADLVQKNAVFMDYLQNGVSVNYRAGNENLSTIVYLVDYTQPEQNSFIIANQWTIVEHCEKRPDVLLFVNGLPLVVMELKSPVRENTDVSEAYIQLRNYMHDIPTLFVYNALCVMSDQLVSKAGTITSGEDRFMEWKTKDGSYENTEYARFDTFFEGIFTKARFLDILKNFICFSHEGVKLYCSEKSLAVHLHRHAERRQGRGFLAYAGERQIPFHGVFCQGTARRIGKPHHCGVDGQKRP